MASSRQPGPNGVVLDAANNDAGTLCLHKTHPPGPVHEERGFLVSTYEAAAEVKDAILRYGHRAWYVYRAWRLSSSKYVVDAIIRKTGEDFYAVIKGLLPGLLIALGIYLLSVVLGTAIGAGIGAFAGGVGAGPGAAAGASVGNSVGLWILHWLGVGFLLYYVGSRLHEMGNLMLEGMAIAWESGGNPDRIDAAAQKMAESIGTFFSLLLQAIAAYLAKEGLAAGAAKLAESRFGRKIVPWLMRNRTRLEVERVLNEVLLDPKASPAKRSRVQTAVEFFDNNRLRLEEFHGGLRPETKDNWLRGTDFSSPVEKVRLKPGDRLTAFVNQDKSRVGNFYTKGGTSPHNLGINPQGRQYAVFEVTQEVWVLRSRTSGLGKSDFTKQQMVLGGGDQFVVPSPTRYLKEVYRSTNVKN